MMRQNGGGIETPPDAWQLYPILDTSNRKRPKRTCNDIVSETRKPREWTGYPAEEAVAIGSNGTGNLLVFVRDPQSPDSLAGQVHWWDHETGDLNLVVMNFGELVLG